MESWNPSDISHLIHSMYNIDYIYGLENSQSTTQSLAYIPLARCAIRKTKSMTCTCFPPSGRLLEFCNTISTSPKKNDTVRQAVKICKKDINVI